MSFVGISNVGFRFGLPGNRVGLAARQIRYIRRRVEQLGGMKEAVLEKTADSLRSRLAETDKATFTHQELNECLALGVAAISRVMGIQLHDVQLQAIIKAANGVSIQMQTGEGKTIVSTLIAYVHSHFEPVHLATTNHYLAQRDYNEMEPVLRLLGCTSGLIRHDQEKSSKREAYRNRVTFGPGYQFGFDYLADQLALRKASSGNLGAETLFAIQGQDIDELVNQPKDLGVMIIDEADSVMIDEATTPLVLSGLPSEQEDQRPYQVANEMVKELDEGKDFQLDLVRKSIALTTHTLNSAHLTLANQKTKFRLVRTWQKYLENAIYAIRFLRRNENYVVVEGKVKIVDQYTGRIFDDRQWQAGLHQAVEAKEGVEINSANQVLAQITRQRYFQKYQKLIGLSGTLADLSRELRAVYRMPIATIPTNLPCLRKQRRPRYFATRDAKATAIAKDVSERSTSGQPVLIGTRTIEQSVLIKEALDDAGVDSLLLNGIQDEEEAAIISQAGEAGAITIATNMAGRGTDIKLSDSSRRAGGLYVVGFEHNFSRRIDRQLMGRCARQGDPGESRFYVSADDELVLKSSLLVKRMLRHVRRDGEIRQDFSEPIKRLQLRHEKKSRLVRQRMNEHVNWLNRVRKTLSDERT